ncbi:MAG: galactose mutarotase [Gemmatimonadota bacterium]|nr:galactose mutarotase [Gemmatimonadota bacterium]
MTGDNTAHRTTAFGTLPDGEAVEMHTLANAAGVEISFLNLGGIITRISVPDRDGVFADVTPGYDTLDHYLADNRYFGALVGRYANRIADARFTLDGVEHRLSVNNGRNHLHGGPHGFHSVIWSVEPVASASGNGAILRHTFAAGSDGYPGTLDVAVTYTLTEASELVIDYVATTDAATPVNLTQHVYFNLAGHASGDVRDHELTLRASHYLPVNEDVIPTGELLPLDETPFDFRVRRPIRAASATSEGGGFVEYDHCFVLDASDPQRAAAVLRDPRSGRTVEVLTTEPGMQFYTGKYIGTGKHGKGGHHYDANTALALETQHFPNSPNEARFPSTILRPGQEFRSSTTYRFTTS